MSPTILDQHTVIRCDNDGHPCDQLDEENGNGLVVASESKQKVGTVSIHVTKALLLLGFYSWSELEEGTEN